MISNFPAFLNVNRLFLKLDRFAWNRLPVLPHHRTGGCAQKPPRSLVQCGPFEVDDLHARNTWHQVSQCGRAKYSLQCAQSRRSQCSLPIKFTISRRGKKPLSFLFLCGNRASLPQSLERPLHLPCMSTISTPLPFTKFRT